jgi:hypothetical protein
MPFETVTHLPLPPGNFCAMLGQLELQYIEEFGPESSEVADVVALMQEFHCPHQYIPVPGKGEPGPAATVASAASDGQPRTKMYLAIVRKPATV